MLKSSASACRQMPATSPSRPPKARPVRIYYMTQAKIAPPVFLLFTNQKKPLHFSFERFLENQLRSKWDFAGTPVRFIQRLRKRGERSGERIDE